MLTLTPCGDPVLLERAWEHLATVILDQASGSRVAKPGEDVQASVRWWSEWLMVPLVDSCNIYCIYVYESF